MLLLVMVIIRSILEGRRMKDNLGKCYLHRGKDGQNIVYLITNVVSGAKKFYIGTVLKVGGTAGIVLNDFVSHERIHNECEEIEESDYTQIYVHVLGKLASKVNATINK